MAKDEETIPQGYKYSWTPDVPLKDFLTKVQLREFRTPKNVAELKFLVQTVYGGE